MSDPHFPIRLVLQHPANGEPLVETSNAEQVQIALPLGGAVSGSVGNLHVHLGGKDSEVTLECVGAVTVADLQWVEQHTITRLFDSVSHFIRFVGGGELRFAFNHAGDLLELSGEAVAMSIMDEGETLVFRPSQASSGQGG